MLVNTVFRPCQWLARPLRHGIRFLPYNRSFAIPLPQRAFSQSSKFASKAKRRAPQKPASYETHASRLAQQTAPTLLYEAQTNLPYIIGCYFIGGGLITCGIINNGTKNLAMVADVPAYVPLFTAIGSFAMIAFGSWMCFRPLNMVKSIRSIPSTELGPRSVLVQIERSRSVPFVTPRTYTVPPRDVTISAPLFLGDEEQVKAELQELQRQERLHLAYDKPSSPRTLPFRILGYWVESFFGGVKKAFTTSGLINFHIKGHSLSWKMETQRAWALEDGRSLDGIVRIKDG